MSYITFTKQKVIFPLFSGICLFSILFLGSWTIYGPLNLRNFTSIIVFILALLSPSFFPAVNSVTKTYFIWLAVYIIVNLFSGNASDSSFIRGLLTYHLLSVFTIISIPHIINDNRSFRIIAHWIVLFYIFDAIITILQFYDVSFAWTISQAINPLSETLEEQIEVVNQGVEGYVGKSIIPGITGFVVSNGYFLTCFLPFVTKGLWENRIQSRLFAFFLLALGVFAIFCTQQRMAFYLTVFYILFLFIYQTKRITKILIAILLLTYLTFNTGFSLDSDLFGRLFSLEDDIRSHTWTNLLLFVSDPMNLLIGMHDSGVGSDSILVLETMSHNSMLDALRRGGLLSIIIMFVLYVRMLFQCISIIIKKCGFSNTTKTLCLSCSLFLVYSLTHSTGLQSGSVECWLLYMMMLSSIYIEKKDGVLFF